MIKQDLLFTCGGNCRKYEKNQPIFFEGNKAMFYYQVMEGSVRMVNTNEDGKEFIQGIFKNGESFCLTKSNSVITQKIIYYKIQSNTCP
jgi:CRP/FNR family transcriptional regulator